MKKIYFLAVFFLATSLFASDNHDSEEMRARYEANITERFNESLRQILLPNSFRLNTSVSIFEKEIETLSPEKRPGFDREKKVDLSKQEVKDDKDFLLQKNPRLKSVQLTLILDSNLREELVPLANQLIRTKMEKNFGNKASLVIKTFDFSKLEAEKDQIFWKDLFKAHVVNFLYLLCGLLVLLIVLFFLKSLVRETRKKSLELSDKTKEKEDDEKEEVPVTEEETKEISEEEKALKLSKNTLFKTLRQDVLAFYESDSNALKGFVKALSKDEVGVLAKALQTSLFSHDILRSSQDHSAEEMKETSITEIMIQNLIENLQDYKKLNKIPLKEPFGFIDRMDSELLASSVKSDTDLALLFGFLSDHKIQDILEELDVKKKAKILALLDQSDFSSGKKQLLLSLDANLRKEFEESNKAEIFYSKKIQEYSLDKILSFDSSVDQVIRLATEEHGMESSPKYHVYTVTFEEILSEHDLLSVKKVIKELDDNREVISLLSYFDETRREKILSAFNATRRNILSSLAHTLEVSDEDKERVKHTFMKIYRSQALKKKV
jgi:hypothetical protein